MKSLALSVAFAFALAATPAAADFVQFQSPTGNIHCYIYTDGSEGEARCDLIDLTPTFRRPPPGCFEGDWGAYFTVSLYGRRGLLACVGDSAVDRGSMVLNYSRSLSVGGFTCASEETGMTCTNPAGHGFSVARAKQQLF